MYPATPHLDDEAFGAKVEFRVVPSSLPPLVWENIVLPAAMDKFDILFAPYTLPWGLARRGVVSNLGIYESRPGDFPTWERLRSTPFFHHSVGEARLVIANSDSTRDDLVRFYGARRESTRVILPGVDAAYTPMDSEYSAQTGMSESDMRGCRRLPRLGWVSGSHSSCLSESFRDVGTFPCCSKHSRA